MSTAYAKPCYRFLRATHSIFNIGALVQPPIGERLFGMLKPNREG